MARKKSKEQIKYNMSRVRNSDTELEKLLCEELNRNGIITFTRNNKTIFGKPDIAFAARKIAVFCDGNFWHGYDWENAQNEIKSNRDFWIPKIERNMQRDQEVTARLQEQGWVVLRFWGHEILKEMDYCISTILDELRTLPHPPYRTIDLCAGIGGIRRGFELTGQFQNVLSSEIDKYACRTYQHLFGDNPQHDLTSDEFKQLVADTPYDILLAGFPCQTFSRVGLQEGFDNEEKGQIFFHISEIIKRTRPFAFFLENVDRLVSHDEGRTFKIILDTLVKKLGYHVIGVERQGDGTLKYSPKAFVRNSRDFGVPQNRPRTYIIGFDTERFSPERLAELPQELPLEREKAIYRDLNDLLEHNVPAKYYMASGYLDTLIRHRARQEGKGYGFGYRIVNAEGIERPIANTLLATGGSGRERNLIHDPQEGIAGQEIRGKKTPLNDQGIRVMTPSEWGKLQGFINYGFINEAGEDDFSFPDGIPDVQRYKQFGNSVTIPVIEEMANFILDCLTVLQKTQ